MFCIKCGKEVNNDMKFCPFCGTNLEQIKNQVSIEESTNDIDAAIIAPAKSQTGAIEKDELIEKKSEKGDQNKDAVSNYDKMLSEMRQLPREKLEEMATAGDLKAILTLGQYDLSKNSSENYNDMDDAIKWLIVGGDKGYYFCYNSAASLIEISEYCGRMIAGSDGADQRIERLESIREKLVSNMPNAKNEKQKEQAEENIYGIDHELGMNYTQLASSKDADDAKECLKKSSFYLRRVIKHRGINSELVTIDTWFFLAYDLFYLNTKYDDQLEEEERSLLRISLDKLENDKDGKYLYFVYFSKGLLYLYGEIYEENDSLSHQYFVKAQEQGADCDGLLSQFSRNENGEMVYNVAEEFDTAPPYRKNPTPMILGIVSILLAINSYAPWVGFVMGIGGMITGGLAIYFSNSIKKKNLQPDKFTKLGLIFGCIGIPLSAILSIVSIALTVSIAMNM